jgi:hypothetical protein
MVVTGCHRLSRGQRSARPGLAVTLVSQRAYAKRRGISQAAVWKRTTAVGGPIPVHGPKKQLDPAEADALWEATMSPQGAAPRIGAAAQSGNPRSTAFSPEPPPPGVTGGQLAQARAAALVVDVQTKRLTLEQRRGALISRDRAVLKAFSFARTLRDACLTWPARIGPQLAAKYDLDAALLTIDLEDHVHQLVSELASERCDF